jgi:hypothetical protein
VVVESGFHGFHVPGASGSDRVCDQAGTLPASTRTPSQRWSEIRFMYG